jgi:hypothetical protein
MRAIAKDQEGHRYQQDREQSCQFRTCAVGCAAARMLVTAEGCRGNRSMMARSERMQDETWRDNQGSSECEKHQPTDRGVAIHGTCSS